MRPFRACVWFCALAALAAAGNAARAGWDDVFQACCFNCKSGQSAFYPPPDPCPCPQPQPCQQCTTHYEQRCFYQPVTSFVQKTYYEPVTTYRTSFFYEPVTSYRYSCYFDPCTCQYQQVACPVTCYRLRSQCCPVTSYLQRCCMQPVTTYRQSFYYVPITTCCTTTVGAPVCQPPAGAAVTQPGVTAPPRVTDPGAAPLPNPPPSVSDGATQPQPPPPGENMRLDRYPTAPAMPRAADESSIRQPQLKAPLALPPAGGPAASPPPKVRIDRIAALPAPNVEGQVVASGSRTPHAGARVLFVSADRQGAQQALTADGDGRFHASLSAGAWLVYVRNADGDPVFADKVEVKDDEPRQVTLVSRPR
jgi:hypothetical protein